MIVEASALLTSLVAAKDIVVGLNTLENETEVLRVKSELTRLLIEAQTTIMTVHADNVALTARIRDAEDWHNEASRYALHETTGGAIVYILKEDRAAGEPQHTLCPKCFADRKKAILQPLTSEKAMYLCNGCKANYRFRPSRSVRNPPSGGMWG